jgi:hypothetical protein
LPDDRGEPGDEDEEHEVRHRGDADSAGEAGFDELLT